MKQRRPQFDEDPLAPVLRALMLVLAVVIIIMALAACSTVAAPAPAADTPRVSAAAPAPTASFPDDMQLVCHEGWAYLYSERARRAIRLPFNCTET